MQKCEFSIKINLSTATLMANHWCLWIETTPQLWMSSRFTYLYPFKHSLKVHTSRGDSVTHFNLNNPNHYHCTWSAEFCYTAIIPRRGKGKKSHKWVPGLFRLLLPLLGPDSHKHSRTSPAWTHISIFFSKQGRHTDLVETRVSRVMLGNCFPWLCSLWSPSLKTFHSL